MFAEVEAKMTTDYEQHLSNWIINKLSVPQEVLNNLPSCPFAKEALLKQKINFVRSSDYKKDIDNILSAWDSSYEVVIVVCDDNIDSLTFANDVNDINSKFVPLGYICLEDHIDCKEGFLGLDFNNGKYNIILCQSIPKLSEAADKLKKNGYYKNWPQEYYEAVFAWRTS